MWGIVDCDNCYVSCERVFRPDLRGKPVVVLSNNDGCVVARSNEAKDMGVRMGMPYYQMRQQFGKTSITAFSSNYELYGNMSARIMSILRDEAPRVLQYSIDEAFLDLEGFAPAEGLKAWGELLAAKVMRWTDMPVSIGIAETKTLAKVASRFAKKFRAYNKCCLISEEHQRRKALMMTDIGDVWGIGRKWNARMEAAGITTAYDFSEKSSFWVDSHMHLPGLRTWKELRGESCIDIDGYDAQRKSICTTRSFAEMIGRYDDLRTQVSNFAAHCAEKLRIQGSAGGVVSVFIDTNRFRTDLPQYGASHSISLATPTSTTIELISAAGRCLELIFREGYQYKRAGVIITDIVDKGAVQTSFLDYDAEKSDKLAGLTRAMDAINSRMGQETVILGAQQYAKTDAEGQHQKFASSIRRSLKSPDYTSRPDEFPLK